MPIRVHVSQLSDEDLLAKLGVKRRAKPRELERPHQVALIKWVREVKNIYPVLKLLYAVPNGGDRNLRVARKLKAEGVLAGVADLCLPAARRGYHGLYLEMKLEEGVATEEQKEFLRSVSGEGYCAVIAQGVDEAQARARVVYWRHRSRTAVGDQNQFDLPVPHLRQAEGAA